MYTAFNNKYLDRQSGPRSDAIERLIVSLGSILCATHSAALETSTDSEMDLHKF